MVYVKCPLSRRDVEDLLAERGIDVCHDTVRFWWNRFRPMFAAEIRRKRVDHMRAYTNLRWHLDEVFVTISGEKHYLWRPPRRFEAKSAPQRLAPNLWQCLPSQSMLAGSVKGDKRGS